MGRNRRLAGLVGWFALLISAIALFTLIDDPRLAVPDITAISSWGDWAAQREPLFATVAILRLLLLGLAWYLLGVSTIQLVARLSRSMALVAVADALSVPLVRRVVGQAMGLGLATSMMVSAGGATTPAATNTGSAPAATDTNDTGPGMEPVDLHAADEAQTAPEPVAMRRLALPNGDHGNPTMTPSEGVTMRPVGASSMAKLATDAQPSMQVLAGPTMTKTNAMWTVESGDHLWGIAEQTLATHHGRPVSDDEIRPYWHRLIELNRDRLVDRDNPDLILPGQQFLLPAFGQASS